MAAVLRDAGAGRQHDERMEAKSLEAELFGGAGELLERLAGDATDSAGEEDFTVSDYLRATGADGAREAEEISVKRQGPASTKGKLKRKPVWTDDDDAKASVDISAKPRLRKLRVAADETELSGAGLEQRLRGQHRKLNPATAWAERPQKERDPDVIDEGALESDAYLRRVGGVLGSAAARGALPAGSIELTRVRDANLHERCKAVVQSVEFHPNGQLLLAAGLDKHLRFFHADGVRNAVVQSVHLEDMPVATARFALGGSAVVAAGHRRFFYLLDLESQRVERVKQIQGCEDRSLARFVVPPAAAGGCDGQTAAVAFLGNEGRVPLVSLRSRQWVGELRMNGTARAAAYSADGTQLMTAGGDGTVYVWDVRMRRCVHRHRDEGCVRSTALALAPSGSTFAAGSDSGVVNLYRNSPGGWGAGGGAARLPIAPETTPPLRALDNLVTEVDTLAFSPDSQILCIGSRMKKDAMRLVHVPTQTVFHNWPTSRSPLHYVHCACFSPNGGFLAVGNAKGHVLMYRLHHYLRA